MERLSLSKYCLDNEVANFFNLLRIKLLVSMAKVDVVRQLLLS